MRKALLKFMEEMTLDELARLGVFTVRDVVEKTSLKESEVKHLLPWLAKKGWLERIEKGKYMVIPLGAEKGKYTVNEFVIGTLLVDPSAIAYWSALNYHGFTEQIPATVFVQTTSRKKKSELEVFGVKYRMVKVSPKKFFGVEMNWIENYRIPITSKEKTIVDCLDKPKYCGGIIEVAKALKSGEFDEELLIDYALRIGNSGVIRRLGYLSELFDLDITLPQVKTRNYLLLDPTMPKKGETNSKWKLIINVDVGEIE